MSLIIKVPNTAFAPGLPKLYRDAVIAPSTRFLYDAINVTSYPKAAAPSAGTPSADKWINLVDGSADGYITTPFTWGGSGGFVSDSGIADVIQAKAGVVPSAETACLGIVWVKLTTPSSNAALANFADMVLIGHTTTAITGVAANRFFMASTGSAAIDTGVDTAGAVMQLATCFDNASKSFAAFINGVQIAARPGYQNMTAPTKAHTLSKATGYGSGSIATYYRWMFDALADGRKAADIVALDYALNAGRFA